MSFVTGYSRHPHHRSYAPTVYGGGGGYPAPQQTYVSQNYGGQPYSHVSRRPHHHHHNYSSSHIGGPQVAYSNVVPGGTQYVTTGSRANQYYPSHHSHARHHTPNVVVAGGRHHSSASYALPAGSTSSSRYHAEGSRGHPVPVIAGRSYREEGVPISTRIRRLFGLGPKRSSGHVGRSVHVKRRGNGGGYGSYFGGYGNYFNRGYFNRGRGVRRSSEDTVYTL